MRKKVIQGKLLPIIAAVVLTAVIAAPVLASPATATRTTPTLVASGVEFDVAIQASGCGAFGQAVETLPEGFAYVGSSLPADQVEQVGNTIKFSFLGDSASFTYRVEAPAVDTTITYTFHGRVLDEDRISYPIEDDGVTVCMKGDFDGDGDVNIFDFVNFAISYGSELGDPNYNAVGDFDDDGDIDIFDFVSFVIVYGWGT